MGVSGVFPKNQLNTVMDTIKQIIIIGGGNSIKKGLSLGLQDHLNHKFVIGNNYSFRHFPITFLTFGDKNFYKSENLSKNPDIYEELKSLPLIIGMDKKNRLKDIIHPNTILLKNVTYCNQIKSAREGFYTKNMLTGVFSISLACFLLDYIGEIYLLGFDWNSTGDTHYYSKEEINHRGQNWHGCYSSHNPEEVFHPFLKFDKIKIYNVNLESKINTFEKITYVQFINQLSNKIENQEELRNYIRNKLCMK